MLILTIFLAAAALVAVITLAVFRSLARRFGMKQLFEDGAVLTEDGIEYLRFFMLGRAKATFDEIESVEVIPFYKAMFSVLFFRPDFSVHTIRTRLSSDFVHITLRRSPWWYELYFRHLLFTPAHAAEFVERLRSHLEKHGKTVA